MSETAYDRIGRGYAATRRPDPRIAARIELALGDAESVVNVGAGTGSYEPVDRDVIAVEPSREMIAQRSPGAAQGEPIETPEDRCLRTQRPVSR